MVVVADRSAKASWIAADLLAQAEHDTEAAAIAIVWDAAFATEIAQEVERQLALLPRREVAAESLRRFGAVFVCLGPDSACRLVNKLAPEHVELLTDDPAALEPRVQHAGALFLGPHTPEAVGDYYAGPNHVLPTSGTARFSSPLGVWDFVKRTSIIQYNAARLAEAGPDIVRLAEAEGLDAHARSVAVRLKDVSRE